MTDIHVRPARPGDSEDRAFLIEMAPRLETGMPAWIPPGALAAAVARSVIGAFEARREGETLLVAEAADGRRLGFVYAARSDENLIRESRGHISEFAVAAGAEGRGVGRALIEAAEDWARAQGLNAMTMEVFCSNSRARAVYEHLGYEPNVLSLRKPL